MYRSSDIYEDIVKVIIEIFLDYDIKDFPIKRIYADGWELRW